MPFALSKKSITELTGVHADLVAVVHRAIQLTTQDFAVHDGIRTLAEQQKYFAAGVAKTMKSKHLPQPDGFGHAVDLVPVINGQLRWEWAAIYPIAAAMRQAVEELGVAVVWGGVWDRKLNDLSENAIGLSSDVQSYAARYPGPDFLDGPHYQLA